MGTVIQNSTLSAMLLEILLKNRSLALDVFKTIIKDDPHFLDELAATNVEIHVDNSFELLEHSFIDSNKVEKSESPLEKTEISDTDIRILAKRQFAKYDAVFKALA